VRIVTYVEKRVSDKLEKVAVARGDRNVSALAARELRAVAARRLPRDREESP
jgi:hypothetical protein